MPTNKCVSDKPITRFINGRILRDHVLMREDLWVREGRILNPEKLFYDEQGYADKHVNCEGSIIAPGFIDTQINGGFGIDFSQQCENVDQKISIVAKNILQHGVTSFCPTLVSSPSAVYHQVLPQIKVQVGGKHGAGVLGVHLEGPFISEEQKGAHLKTCLKKFSTNPSEDLMEVYGHLDNVAIVTLAPELEHGQSAVRELCQRGVTVSLGHSTANLPKAEEAVRGGASFITHLFNAMLPFHHRDPGILGLLTSDCVPATRTVYYGMIADNIHSRPAALRIAHRAHPSGLVLVTDAIAAMGLPPGEHTLGQQVVEIRNNGAFVSGTDTLCGSIATMDLCVRNFKEATGCSTEEALEAASLHPAQLLAIDGKGRLDYGADADLVVLDNELKVKATYISGEEVWREAA